MYARMQAVPHAALYHRKKNKEPDHLFNLINKIKVPSPSNAENLTENH